MSQTIYDAPLFNREHPNHRRSILRTGLTALAFIGAGVAVDRTAHGAVHAVNSMRTSFDNYIDGPSPLTSQQLAGLPKEYVAGSGDTVWSIATAEGPQVANNENALMNAELDITAQIPGRNPSALKSGDTIYLPADSQIGFFVKK